MTHLNNLFITGAAGCVGHYILDHLLPNPGYRLSLLLRDPGKLRQDRRQYPQVTIIEDDLENIERYAGLLASMDLVIHAAAAWGGQEAFRVNVDATHRLFNLLDPGRCRKVLYFSTASILDARLQPIPEAGVAGTEYVRSKYQAYVGLKGTLVADRILTLFPTLILGGDAEHPYTFLSAGLPDILRWAWLFRFLTVDGSFHFIHARDIGRIVAYLLEHEVPQTQLVLGNPRLTVGQAVEAVASLYGWRSCPRVDLTPAVELTARLLGNRLPPWDRFCLSYRHFVYEAVSADTFGLPTDLTTLEAALAALPNLGQTPGRA